MPRGVAPGTERALKFAAAGRAAQVRKREEKKLAQTEMALGPPGHRQEISPATWLPVGADIGECQYMDEADISTLLKNAELGLVYAHRCGCHHTHAFEDVVLRAIVSACCESVREAESRLGS